MTAVRLQAKKTTENTLPIIGIFATCDPRIDENARERAGNIVEMAADAISGAIVSPKGDAIPVVYSDILVDGETQADIAAEQFKKAGVSIIVCVPDTWSFPQLTVMSLLAHFPKDIPFNFTTGN